MLRLSPNISLPIISLGYSTRFVVLNVVVKLEFREFFPVFFRLKMPYFSAMLMHDNTCNGRI